MKFTSMLAAAVIAVTSITAMAPVAQARERGVAVEGAEIQLVRDHRRDRDRRHYQANRRYDRYERRYDRRYDRRYYREGRRYDRRPPWHHRDRRHERGNWQFRYR